ncbi:endospore germination permease [Cohnella sp. GbtcB17]|uniref:GerAB/ArcD/ProY family transporter n=1 Tax=Cohnella sp. GbtcB17 TaxID=2824762 RepID=UPI001C3042E7|nr:endospore germination permease [Cohnella sp. GbtcB17]
MNKISNYQLFAITFIFQLGTTIIFGFGSSAGRDAWIGELISCGLGVFIILIYIALMKLHPGLTLVQWFPVQFGRWIGTPISFLYPLMLIYVAGRIIADVRDMVSTALLSDTPLILTAGLFAIIIAYCVYGGIESVSRLGEIFLPIVLILFLLEVILLFGSDVLHLDYLQPSLEKGWMPIQKAVFPAGITQSFGETLVFAMFWPQTKHPEKVMRITLLATLLSGIMITCFDVLAIMAFGNLFPGFLYPLYTLLSVISVGEFIENLQMFGVLYFLMTALLKCVVLLLAAITGIQQITKMNNYRVLVLPACAIALILGLTMSKNIAEHIYRHHFEILVPYIWVPMLLVLPGFLLAVTLLRRMKM